MNCRNKFEELEYKRIELKFPLERATHNNNKIQLITELFQIFTKLLKNIDIF